MTKEQDQRTTRSRTSKVFKILGVIALDIALAGGLLLIYATFHHVLPRKSNFEPIAIQAPVEVISETAVTADETELVDVNDESTEQPSEEPIVELTFREKYADKFTDGETIITENSYITETIHITVDTVKDNGATYFVADIYLCDITNFKTAFSHSDFIPGKKGSTLKIINKNNGIVGISGDYYGIRQEGLVIRNGVLYRDSVLEDVLVMFYDGTMETIAAEDVDVEQLIQRGAYQSWSFGPVLLQDGQVIEKFDTPITAYNPRSSVGYYEPGHYCFIVVDGRQQGYSDGVTLPKLSQIYYDLGCTVAYNLDGGQTAAMVYNGNLISKPAGGGRSISDVILIADNVVEEVEADE